MVKRGTKHGTSLNHAAEETLFDDLFVVLILDHEVRGVILDPEVRGVILDPEVRGVILDPEARGVILDPEAIGVILDPEVRGVSSFNGHFCKSIAIVTFLFLHRLLTLSVISTVISSVVP
jgi:hypothetical protein